MKYAVVKTGGKQYKVSEGDVIEVERLQVAPKDQFTFENVLLVVEDGIVKIGSPMLSGVKVVADVVDNIRGEKLRIAKFKAKARYRRVTGHRQALTQLKIAQISQGNAKKEVKETPTAPQKSPKRTKKS